MKKIFTGLSLRPDKHFARNIIIVVGIVLVWRGVRHLADIYLLADFPVWSSIVSLALGVVILYLPDGHLDALGASKEKEEPLLNHTTRDAIIIITVAVLLLVVVAIAIQSFL